MSRSDTPVISVMMPAFNAARTLPRATASLLAQTHQDWECVLVDDGSTDGTPDVVSAIDDGRIRYIRLGGNRGRGFARQIALAHASGVLLSMLDADDWYYPDLLECQVRMLQERPDLGAISGGMAITDERNELVGIRVAGSGGRSELRVCPPLRSLLSINVFHAPSMIRMDLARHCVYSARLDRAEDFHFLAQVLGKAPYGVHGSIGYAYSERASVSREGLIERYQAARPAYRMLRSHYPVSSFGGELKVTLQATMARLPVTSRLAMGLFRRGTRPPTAEERGRFVAARAQVDSVFQNLNVERQLVVDANPPRV